MGWVRPGLPLGHLMGAPPVSPVDFKKLQCPLSLFLKFPCRFKMPQCHLSILRNGNVPCYLFLNVPDDFKVAAMSPVELKKMPYRPVKFKGQGDTLWLGRADVSRQLTIVT